MSGQRCFLGCESGSASCLAVALAWGAGCAIAERFSSKQPSPTLTRPSNHDGDLIIIFARRHSIMHCTWLSRPLTSHWAPETLW